MPGMRIEQVVRFAIMILAGAVALAGILVMTGVLANAAINGQIRIVMGAAIFLYGVYRFTIAYFRRPEGRDS